MNKLIRITTVPISLDKLLDRQMSFMKDYYEVIAVSSDEASLKNVGEKDGVETYCVEMTRQITPIKDLKSLWKLYRFFRKEKPLFVHTHTPKAGTVGMLAAWMARVPNRLHTIAGLPLLEATGMKRALLNLVEKITYRCATKIYPNSFGLQAIIEQEGYCNPNKLKVLGNGSSNGIDTRYFDPSLFSEEHKDKLRTELKIDKKDFVFIFVGRLVGDKGINELVQAFDSISQSHAFAKLLLVGPQETKLDPLRQETLSRIEKNENIISVGYQADVRPFFAIADALVFPSYREGFPNVVMQAGAMGLPSIVSDINGCNEIIIEGQNGTIIPSKDASVLKEKMELFIIDELYLKRLRDNAREMIVSRYQQKVVWEAILREYKILEEQYVSKLS